MPLVLDSTQSVSVDVTHYVIQDFSINPNDKVARVRYQKGVVDSTGAFIAASSNTLSISGSNYDDVVRRSEEINTNTDVGVYGSVKEALYEYIADYEGVTGTVQ